MVKVMGKWFRITVLGCVIDNELYHSNSLDVFTKGYGYGYGYGYR